jgi:hypothetical protein
MNRPGDRPLHVRRRLILMGCGVAAFGLSRVLAAFPGIVEAAYANGFWPGVVAAISRVSGWAPFSVAEWVLLAFVARQLLGAGRGLTEILSKRRRPVDALAAGALRLGADLGIVVALFYLLWGFNYARAPLDERLGWTTGPAPQAAELARLAGELVVAGNAAYLELHGVEDLGVETTLPDDLTELERAIDDAWGEVGTSLGIPRLGDRTYGRAKRMHSSRALCYLFLGGFFFVWTGEPTVNGAMPAIAQPHSMAHEKAHQRGFAPEDEANFIGFMAAASADHPLARYSAYLFAQDQLLRALRSVDRSRAEALIDERLPGVKRDVASERAFWERFRGPTARVAKRTNDLYLRSNRVEDGTLSYGRSLTLMVEYARRRGTLT